MSDTNHAKDLRIFVNCIPKGNDLFLASQLRASDYVTLYYRQLFYEFEESCAENGGHAVTIETEGENEFIKQYLGGLDTDGSFFFLGITDDCTGDVWRQTETGDVMTCQDFWIGEPNGAGVDYCIGVHESTSYRWLDGPCINFTGRTVCEKRPN